MQLTETAASKVKELLQEQANPEVALRVAAEPGGCCGYRYAMGLTDEVGESDLTEEQHGIRIVTDRASAPLLAEARIDFIDTLEQTGFAIHNPSARGSHGHEHGHEHGRGHGHAKAGGGCGNGGACACGH